MSETVKRAEAGVGAPPGQEPGKGPWATLVGLGRTFAQQREATVFVIAVLLLIYFGLISSAHSNFFTRLDFINITQIMAQIAIIACGEVLLLICGEIDLSPGFVFLFAPYLMHYLIDFYGVPAVPAVLIVLLMGLVVGAVNGFFTVTVGVPSFITTFATAFILQGLTLYTSHAEPSVPPTSTHGWMQGLFGELAWSELIMAVVIVAIFHVLLTRTRWGLHTIATGGNQLGASEAGVNVARIKYGNFMLTSLLGAITGLMVAFQLNTIDPAAGGFQAMFYAVTAAVIGGTAMLGGSGTVLGAFLGSIVLALLLDGFNLVGYSGTIISLIFGAAVLLAMVVNVQLARVRAAGRA